MTMIHTLMVLAATVAAEPRGEVLDFSATWCGPCQRMSPVVSRLEREGLPIRKVDVDEERELAQRFNVTSIPTFILVIDGEEVTRVVGATTEAELRRMIASIPQPAPAQPEPPDTVPLDAVSTPTDAARGQVPRAQAEQPLAQVQPESEQDEPRGRGFFDIFTRNDAREPEVIRALDEDVPSQAAAPSANDPLIGSTRIRVTIDGRINLGSGTIVGSRPGMTLVLTCGHIFRGLNDASKVEVDVFAAGAHRTYVGSVVKFDLESDVGLITIPTDRAVPAVAVCRPENVPVRGDRVACIGCSGGDDPTREQLQVTEINKYQGPDNIECTGIPVQGRSGGGLFNTSGELIGVCIAADPEGQRGLYAHVHAIHDLLDECGLTPLYQPAPPDSRPAAPEQLVADAPQRQDASPQSATLQPAAAQDLLDQAGVTDIPAGDAEIVVIIRPRNQPQAPSRVVIINQASPKFFAYLNGELETPAIPAADRIMQTTQTIIAPEQPEWYEARRFATDAPAASQPETVSKQLLQPTSLTQPAAPRPYVRSATAR